MSGVAPLLACSAIQTKNQKPPGMFWDITYLDSRKKNPAASYGWMVSDVSDHGLSDHTLTAQGASDRGIKSLSILFICLKDPSEGMSVIENE